MSVRIQVNAYDCRFACIQVCSVYVCICACVCVCVCVCGVCVSSSLATCCVFTAACSRGYNISLYPDYQSVNTEVVEQANSDLSNQKSSLSCMNKCNFVSHLKLFLYYRNKKFLQL